MNLLAQLSLSSNSDVDDDESRTTDLKFCSIFGIIIRLLSNDNNLNNLHEHV